MSYKMQLAKGKRVEREHKNTYLYLKRNVATTGKLPNEDKFYTSIATDHVKEDSKYYDKLKKAKLWVTK